MVTGAALSELICEAIRVSLQKQYVGDHDEDLG